MRSHEAKNTKMLPIFGKMVPRSKNDRKNQKGIFAAAASAETLAGLPADRGEESGGKPSAA